MYALDAYLVYVGHDAEKPGRVFKSGQKRGVHGQIRRELRRRSAIEAVIGHCKTDGHLGRNFLQGRLGDHINAVMSAVGYNLRLILKWLSKILCLIIRVPRHDVGGAPTVGTRVFMS